MIFCLKLNLDSNKNGNECVVKIVFTKKCLLLSLVEFLVGL